MGMLLYMQDCFNFLVALGIKHFNSPFDVRYCVDEKVSQQVVVRLGSCISVKITSFCLFRTKSEIGLESGGVVKGRQEYIQSKEVPYQFRGAK